LPDVLDLEVFLESFWLLDFFWISGIFYFNYISFTRFIERVIEYIDEYYLLKKRDKNGNIIEPKRVPPSLLYEAISPFGLSTINGITWNHITKCIELFQLKNLNENDLFNEFSGIQMIFKYIQDKNISLFDQVQLYINKKSNPNISIAASTKISSNNEVEEEQDVIPTQTNKR
jgi:hypothetical protein